MNGYSPHLCNYKFFNEKYQTKYFNNITHSRNYSIIL